MGGWAITLPGGLGNELLKGFRAGPATNVNDAGLRAQFGEAHATMVGGRCIIIEVPATVPAAGIEHRALILLDADSGLPFAYYCAGNYRPRILWQERISWGVR